MKIIKVQDDVHLELLKLTVNEDKKRTMSEVIKDLLKKDKK